MNKRNSKKLLSGLICFVLIAVTALTFTACDKKTFKTASSVSKTDSQSSAEITEVGEGKTVFNFKVIDRYGSTKSFSVKTDKTVVGEALEELGLIEGEEGQFGLYVKKVDGITADFDVDGTYWAFYVDGSYASSGIDVTEIESGRLYEMRVEK